MLRFMTYRLIETIPVLLLMSVVVFGLVLLIPGDPVLAVLGPAAQADQAAVQAMRQELRLDDPIPVQYMAWLGRAVRGDLGRSVATRQPAIEALLTRLPVTIQLSVLATFLALLIAMPLGILAATRQNSGWDILASGTSVLGLAIPNFFLAILLVLVFAVWLGWLPASGYVPLTENPVEWLRHLLLPSIALALGAAGVLMRQIRSSLLEVLHDDYVRTAHAKGLPEHTVLVRHALRNSLIPTVTVLGILLGRLMGGSLIVESIFLIPGVGSLLVNAIFSRDFPVVQAGTLVLAIAVIFINLGVDVLYRFIDPRVA